MIDIKKIPASERLKPLLDGIAEEIEILDKKREDSERKIKSLLNELDLAILEIQNLNLIGGKTK